MSGFYERWVLAKEERMHSRDSNRVVRPFGWGLEYLDLQHSKEQPAATLGRYAAWASVQSDQFYALTDLPEFHFDGELLRFSSPIQNHHEENNTVYGRYFPCSGAQSAVVVLPHWNAKPQAHTALCRLLNRFGMTALRLSLPFHDDRRPPELERSDYLVDSNIGRTLLHCRQAVLDTRLAVEWFWHQGFQHIGVLGTSLGACIAFLAFVHEPRLEVAVFNHASSYFADVVWEGMTTRHVRQGLEGNISLDDLRRYWTPISPLPFVKKLRGQSRRSLVVSARYDPTFPPRLTRDFIAEYRRYGIPIEEVLLPCGHYSLGSFPFSWIDGYAMIRFLKRELDFRRELH
jgi:hypothetical protein